MKKQYTLRYKAPKPYGKINGKPFPTGILGRKFFPTRAEAETFYADALKADPIRFIGEVKS